MTLENADAGAADAAVNPEDAVVTGTNDKAGTDGAVDKVDPAAKAEATPEDKAAKAAAEQAAKDAKPGLYPDDWRERFAKEAAGDDEKAYEKELKRLQRFSSVADVYKSNREMEKKLSSGELKKKLGDKATPEEIAAYRKENGIPEKPEDYKIELEGGIVPGEADKPLIDAFAKDMHGINAPPEVLNAALNSYYKLVEQQAQAIAERDHELRVAGEDELRQEFGGEYRANLNLASGVLAAADPEVRNLLWGEEAEKGKFENGARLADGSLLRDNPKVIRWLTHIAREINPAGTVMPNGGANAPAAIEDEMAALEKLMANKSSAYWRGPDAEAKQQRYRDLITAKEKIAARS